MRQSELRDWWWCRNVADHEMTADKLLIYLPAIPFDPARIRTIRNKLLESVDLVTDIECLLVLVASFTITVHSFALVI